MRSRLLAWVPIALAWSACGPLPLELVSDAGSRAEAVDADVLLGEFDGADASRPTTRTPRVRIDAPRMGAVLDGDSVRIEGTADDDRGIASVAVRVGPNQPLFAQSADGFRSWSVSAPLFGGALTIEAVARDLDGVESAPERVSVVRARVPPDDAPPVLAIVEPAPGSAPLSPLALVRGTASDDRAVVAIEVRRNGELLRERPVETSDFFAHWSRLVPLTPGVRNELVVTARDESGQEARATLVLEGRPSSDRLPPSLTLAAPSDGARFSAASLTVTGSARDDLGVREVKVRLARTPGGASAPVFGAYVPAETRDGFASFRAQLEAPPGALQIEVRAIDLNGLATTQQLRVVNERVEEFGDEVALPLRLHDDVTAPTLQLALTQKGIDEVFSEPIQREVRLLELDTTALITDAVTQIKTSCGTRWRENSEDPRHDCSATSYGKDRTPPIPWQQTPEYSMVRLLTMTPANVVVRGTSLGNLQSLADALDIGGGFHDILADTLGIPPTQEIVSTAAVVRALQEFWLATHPEVLPGARLPITLYDSMHQLAPLSERFGPRGDHPGLLDSAFPPRAQLFTDAFQMKLSATSNLRWMDGVRLSGAGMGALKDYIALVVDTTGPSYDDVLEFDFNDPARFDVLGLVPAPRADLRMLLRENTSFIRTCTGDSPTCRNNLPSSPARGYVWSNPRWQIESVVAGSAYYQYAERRGYTRTYNLLVVPAAIVTMGANGNPPGWSTFQTLLRLGDPPPAQYIWETISEVAQVALHNYARTVLPEGGVNVAFTLHNVNVGLSADAIRSAMRPRLQAQRAELSRKLLGDYRKNNGAVDFYYRRGADGAPYVYFVAASDPLPGGSYPYERPGFYADPALTTKRSQSAPDSSGDGAHEKLALQKGETVAYAEDEGGAVYRLRFIVGADPREIDVFVSKKVR